MAVIRDVANVKARRGSGYPPQYAAACERRSGLARHYRRMFAAILVAHSGHGNDRLFGSRFHGPAVRRYRSLLMRILGLVLTCHV